MTEVMAELENKVLYLEIRATITPVEVQERGTAAVTRKVSAVLAEAAMRVARTAAAEAAHLPTLPRTLAVVEEAARKEATQGQVEVVALVA